MRGIPTIPKWFAYDCVSSSMLILTVESELPVHWIRWQNPSFTETSFLSVGILNSVGISNGKWNIALPNCNLPDIPLFWMSHHNSPWKGRPFGDSMDWFKGKVTEIYIYTHMGIWLYGFFYGSICEKYGKISGFPMVSDEDFPLNPSIEGWFGWIPMNLHHIPLVKYDPSEGSVVTTVTTRKKEQWNPKWPLFLKALRIFRYVLCVYIYVCVICTYIYTYTH